LLLSLCLPELSIRYPSQVICTPPVQRVYCSHLYATQRVGAGRAGPTPPCAAGRGGPWRAGSRAGGAGGACAPSAAGAAARPGAAAARPARRARPSCLCLKGPPAQPAGAPRLSWLRQHSAPLLCAASASRRVCSCLCGLPAMRAWLRGSTSRVSGCQRTLT